jgi:hypothetical protein
MRKHHKEDNSCWEISFRKSSVRWSIPKDSSVRESNHIWKVNFSIDEKEGEIYQMQDRELDAWTKSTKAWF